jgi:hypothetical protein
MIRLKTTASCEMPPTTQEDVDITNRYIQSSWLTINDISDNIVVNLTLK